LKNGKIFTVKTSQGEYPSKTIIFATGTEHKKLAIPSITAFENRGVSYCATCDGPLFKGKTVAVVGSGDSAAKEALLLTEYAEKVFLIVRKEDIHPEPINKIRVEKNKKIEIVNRSNVISAKGGKFLEEIVLDSERTLTVQGLFIEIGRIPQTNLARKLGVALNNGGEIIIDRISHTNIPGFFAAGDCTDTEWKQAITGVGEAAHAANSAYEYMTHEHVEEA
ncbi:FAD-dependent oxidoreductase, partial [Candidatus Peregrinibacteria bacterium]|nr:FAD-dependent oxidoreductase [Candidatus Peregrinibacteria bacterium]